MEERLKYGGIESLQEEERLRYETQIAMEQDYERIKGIVHKLIYEDMFGIDSRLFESYKNDDSLMDEWTKQLIEKVLVEYEDSPLLRKVRDLLMLADKELYRQLRDKKITLGQFKTRCMEKLDGNRL